MAESQPEQDTPLQRALALVGIGVVARHCGISPQSVHRWKVSGVPFDRAPGIEVATGGRVRCEDICPGVAWHRDEHGYPVAYTVRIESVTLRAIA